MRISFCTLIACAALSLMVFGNPALSQVVASATDNTCDTHAINGDCASLSSIGTPVSFSVTSKGIYCLTADVRGTPCFGGNCHARACCVVRNSSQQVLMSNESNCNVGTCIDNDCSGASVALYPGNTYYLYVSLIPCEFDNCNDITNENCYAYAEVWK